MNKEQRMVWDWHKAMKREDLNCNKPQIPEDLATAYLRVDLIDEEMLELETEIERNNLVGVADALGDLLYVVYGAACTFGIDLEPIFEEIQRSNMTKFGASAREDGKILKGEAYEAPILEPILEKQKQEGIVND